MIYGIVVTTIYQGAFIQSYYEHFAPRGEAERVRFYVVGDLATPAECADRVARYAAQGLDWQYLSPDAQTEFLRPFPDLAADIPWRSDNRRNVGFLMAYRDRCDVIVSIDDDNYPRPDWPFLDGHAAVGKKATLQTATGRDGWFNVCSLMDVECASLGVRGTVYPRGFPYARRNLDCSATRWEPETGFVAVNAGLWSGDPDVDAATRLVTRCHAREAFANDYLLATETLTPVNTQNTALIRDAIPAYYYVKMGAPVGGMKLDRFGDIFSGYFLQKAARAVGHRVKIGAPVVEHRRTPHNLYADLWNELAGMATLDDMLPLLESPLSPAPDYESATLELAERLAAWSVNQSGFLWDDGLRAYFTDIARTLRLWVAACRQLK
jgi:hypothetical protein